MKRVCCLYRVSTKAQAYDDLYLQKSECREFAKRNQWEIVKEIQMQGKSGLLDLKHRSDLQSILELAQAKAFDILLVFMFDRIGRRNDETSIFTLLLDQSGIQIWSVQEGVLDFTDHLEKLRNYINYWHAENESINTSKRVKTKMNQLAADGLYRGGNIPFGYHLVLRGRTNRAGQLTHDLEIDTVNADIVRKIFDLYLESDYGTYKIADSLNQQKILSGTGKRWHPDRIHYLLKNRTYMGIIRNGQTESDIIPELQIITPDRFSQAQEKMAEKSRVIKPLPVSTAYEALFIGKVRCGHCGEPMGIRCTSARYETKSGQQQIYRNKSYVCKSKSKCKPKSVNAELVDQAIIETAAAKIMKIKKKEIRQVKTPEHNARLTCIITKLSEASLELRNIQIELSGLEACMYEAVAANNFETLELLTKQKETLLKHVSYREKDITTFRQQYTDIQKAREQFSKSVKQLLEQIRRADIFSDEKQMDFLLSVIEYVTVYGKGNFQITWNKEFQYILDYK